MMYLGNQEVAPVLDTLYKRDVEEKDLTFYDYDGTILYSYTKAEADQLTTLPQNPSHIGLIAQGWNYTLAEISTQLTKVGKCDVGQNYITDDGKTRLYISLASTKLSPCLKLCPNGTTIIDWGDGSQLVTITGTSLNSSPVYSYHTYSVPGDYVIKLNATSGNVAFWSGPPIRKSDTATANENRPYYTSLIKAEIGNNTVLGSDAFNGAAFLETVTIPATMTSIGGNSFRSCPSILAVIVPHGCTVGGSFVAYDSKLKLVSFSQGSIPNGSTYSASDSAIRKCVYPYNRSTILQSANSNCSSMKKVYFANDITSIGASAFYSCSCIEKIVIPATVTSIGTKAFYNNYSLGEIHFLGNTPPIVSNIDAWNNLPTDCKIYVPTGKKSTYENTENYPDKLVYTYIEE